MCLETLASQANANGDQVQLRSALQVISDSVLINPNYIIQYIQQMIIQIKGILQNQMLHLDCKLRAIETLGDICTATEDQAVNYIYDIMSTLTQACDTSFNKGETDEEVKQYSELRENLVTCFVWMVHYLTSNDKRCETIGTYMFDYIMRLVNAGDLGYSNEVLKDILDLYGDLVFIFGQHNETNNNFWTSQPQPQPEMTELMNKILNNHQLIGLMQNVCN